MEMFIIESGMFMQKQYTDPIKQEIDSINDPINIVELSEREKNVIRRIGSNKKGEWVINS